MDNFDDDFLDDYDVLDELDEFDLEDDYHLELPLEELDPVDDFEWGERPTLQDLNELLRLGKNLKPANYKLLVYGLSDLSSHDAHHLFSAWQSLETTKRQEIMEMLVDSAEENYMFDYRSWAIVILNDHDSQVRAAGVELLWDDESLDIMHKLIDLIRTEKSVEVRVAAFAGLGRFILRGEYEEVNPESVEVAKTATLEVWDNPKESVEVRRRALEAISNCSHHRVPEMIKEAYKSHLPEMQVSAVFAMGRTYDTQWTDIVLKELDNENPQIRYEAVRAAGELELKKSVQQLGKLARDDSDREIMLMAIWSLGEIGGDLPTKILTRLAEMAEESDDDDLIDAIDEAIQTASLGGLDV